MRCGTPRAGTKVRVIVELRDGEPTIEVDNEGRGISAKDRERIFDPMAVGENGLGTGLGLFVVSRVVERHGGTIRCNEGEAGHVTFELRLPPVGRHRSRGRVMSPTAGVLRVR